jgi:hypothetical protein
MARSYVPDVGDIVWISSRLQARHEPAGHRPAVGLSPVTYNAMTIVCSPSRSTFSSLNCGGQCSSRHARALYSKLLEINPTRATACDWLAALNAEEGVEKPSPLISRLFCGKN